MEKVFYETRPYVLAFLAIALPLKYASYSPILLGSCALLFFVSLYVIKMRLEHRSLAPVRKSSDQ